MSRRRHTFGGSWTQEKLDKVGEYLERYTTALKNQPFDLVYIDAFAGTGYRTSQEDRPGVGDLFSLSEMPDMIELMKGSARIALEIEPPFDRYIFIEKNRKRFEALKELETDVPDKSNRMEFRNEEANAAIIDICRTTNWRKNRAVMFLDPYGMQVNWETIEAIAATKSVDLWYLFPAGMGIVRMTPHHGDVPEAWQARLDTMLGDPSWREVFYVERRQTDLFGDESVWRQKATDIARIEAFLLDRLREIFAGVSRHALHLKNKQGRGQTMYLLTFACGNPKGAKIALRIAEHILKS